MNDRKKLFNSLYRQYPDKESRSFFMF